MNEEAACLAAVEGWRRDRSRRFVFVDRAFDAATGEIRLSYELDGIELSERIGIPVPAGGVSCPAALAPALDLLHWVAGVSYWKAGCPGEMTFADGGPDAWQARWLERLYRDGLAEMAWRNGGRPDIEVAFPAPMRSARDALRCDLPRRSLVPMGGGKDSLVALERVRALGEEPVTIQVGAADLIRRVARAAGTRHLVVERRLDPGLSELNRLGAWNGHVPVTAINAAILVVVALVHGFDRVVFANERSADEATLIDAQGRAVNHQFSKSLAFERMLGSWVARYVTPDLRVFSILRRDRELAVCREFAGLERYHGVFSSCNRNFHIDGARTERWCGNCPKCRFVFLSLAPFLEPAALAAIFGVDLLDDPAQIDGFRALLAIDDHKPFECVGEVDEARAALAALSGDRRWSGTAVVEALSDLPAVTAAPALSTLCRPGGEHCIPDDCIGAT